MKGDLTKAEDMILRFVENTNTFRAKLRAQAIKYTLKETYIELSAEEYSHEELTKIMDITRGFDLHIIAHTMRSEVKFLIFENE